ncbi:hypothetical protein DFJ73DRAFT_797648 [Zopfochytrium polystomum]|nr:hypothetical protein DFJ73DRAFT_797648 [Zopfochytrium polystomum]
MDPSQFITFGASYMISAGVTIVLATAHWDSIARIGNPILLWTMIIPIFIQAVEGFFIGYLFLKLSRDFDFDSFMKMQDTFAYLSIFGMILLTVHATYRALIISSVRPFILHVITGAIFASSATLHMWAFTTITKIGSSTTTFPRLLS